MRRYNNTGCIRRLKGNRRKPFQAVVTAEYDKELKKQKIKSLGTFETFIDAEIALCNYYKNEKDKNINKITLKNLFDKFIKFKNNKITKNTIRLYESSFKKIKKIENKNIDDINLIDLQKVIDPLSPAYRKNVKTFLVILFNFAIKNDYLHENKAQFIEISKYKPKKKKVFTKDEISFVRTQKEDIYKIINILLYTGLRISELINLKISDIDLKERIIYIKNSKTENGIRLIPIHENILKIIIDFIYKNKKYLIEKNSNKYSYSTLYCIFKRTFKNHTIHEIRHTFITNCKECDIDMYIIKLLCGHSSKDLTLDTYTHISEEKIKQEFKKFNYK